ITMGEMASSLAHELNQPLTAISNYTSGMIARVKTHGMAQHELIDALEKTGRQAQRAAAEGHAPLHQGLRQGGILRAAALHQGDCAAQRSAVATAQRRRQPFSVHQ
ncbi:MAG: histidine kinase dimerization/phospho-acceptor domain-containing protein, partial [Flavobacteriales bacterium]